MKVIELFESLIEQDIRNCIDKKIIELQKILNHFDVRVSVVGYQTVANEVLNYLEKDSSIDYYISIISTSNPKLQKSVIKLNNIRQKLINRINSGI